MSNIGVFTTNIDIHIGKRLRRRRRLLGLTQTQLAEAVGLRFQQIQKYECGVNRIMASRLYELANVLNCSLMYFYHGLDGANVIENNPAADTWRVQKVAAEVSKLSTAQQDIVLNFIKSVTAITEKERTNG